MKSQLVCTAQLSDRDREAMYSLLATHFEGVRPDVFTADLAQKNWVILLKEEATGDLKGFSTFLMMPLHYDGQLVSIVYSGDTIMDPSAWSSTALPRAWIAAVNALQQQFSDRPLYWFLICSGYRTYRFLPVFWKEFYPRYNVPTPPSVVNLMAFLGTSLFGEQYDAAAGIIHLLHPQRLRPALSDIPAHRQCDRHIEFFLQKNPGHLQGDELACLTHICPENLTAAGRRMWFAPSPFSEDLIPKTPIAPQIRSPHRPDPI